MATATLPPGPKARWITGHLSDSAPARSTS